MNARNSKWVWCWSRIVASAWIWFVLPLAAHVGSPNVVFEAEAGPHPLRVVIRTPPVVPGLAQISVRVKSPGPHQVHVLPVKWDAGRKGAPPPDEALPVKGESNLYSAELWLMTSGAHGVVVRVNSAAGTGEAVVPVNAIATRRLVMSQPMTGLLITMGALLIALICSIARAALNECLLDPGEIPTRRRIWSGRIAAVTFLGLITLALYGGGRWWSAVDRHFLSSRLYRPPEINLTVSERNGARALRLEIDDPRWEKHQRSPLVLDHGKLMHLFLVRQPGLDAFAHLHPAGREDRLFDTALPALPDGKYLVFADVTQETGLAQTLTGQFELRTPSQAAPWHHPELKLDENDSWHISESLAAHPSPTTGHQPSGHRIEWEPLTNAIAGQDLSLRFRVLGSQDKPAPLELYMGMPGHAIVLHEDQSVFTHLHPQGTASMAALMAFAKRELDINAVRRLDDLICGVDAANSTISFPYAFPKPGRYRLWIQCKSAGEILTRTFDIAVSPSS